MNSSLFSLITVSFLCFLLLGWTGNGSKIHDITQQGDTTEVVTVPINTDRSLVKWKGTEMWQTGEHEGIVNFKRGYLSYQNGQIVGGKFIADMNSITITDIPKHELVARRNLRNHLNSEDFFHVKKYPTAAFEITKTEAINANSLRVWGALSIRDVTQSISFIASKKPDQNSALVFNATFKIDRFAWNVAYQGSYWKRITSILDNTFVDADIYLTVNLFTVSLG